MEFMNQNENRNAQAPDGFAPQQPYRQPVIIVGNPEENKRRTKNLAIFSLVFGILSIVFCIFFSVSIFLGIIGLIQALISLGQHRDGRSHAIAGVITSTIGTVLSVISFLVWILVIANI